MAVQSFVFFSKQILFLSFVTRTIRNTCQRFLSFVCLVFCHNFLVFFSFRTFGVHSGACEAGVTDMQLSASEEDLRKSKTCLTINKTGLTIKICSLDPYEKDCLIYDVQ